jgi:hypothetical protein
MMWEIRNRADQECREVADRHYNRQKIGAPQFVPPGRCLVLLHVGRSREKSGEVGRALWVTSWPFAEYVKHAWAGAWVNSCFRNESTTLSSALIVAAVVATRERWPDVPELGMVTFVDPGKVKHKRDFGRCYLRAGFERVGSTKGGLVALQMMPDVIAALTSDGGTVRAVAPGVEDAAADGEVKS